jgi:kynurenine formamidase
MCHHCVIESVKAGMLSRHNFFKGSIAAAGAAALAATAAPTPLFAQAPGKAEDLTHELWDNFPTYFGGQQFFAEQKFSFAKDTFNLYEWRISEHTGTHIDAPLHFTADGKSVAELPIEDLIAPLAVIDIRGKADKDPDAQVTPDDIQAWISANGDLPEGAVVAMLSGWARMSRPRNSAMSAMTARRCIFPGFHVEAAQFLIEQPSVKAIAVDTLSLDHGPSPDFIVHNTWLPTGRYGIEAVANLDRLPAKGATIVVGAPKVRGGTGGPARIFAMV